jgi:NOL1/NOP2/fmu family ribosome biogenesis protein
LSPSCRESEEAQSFSKRGQREFQPLDRSKVASLWADRFGIPEAVFQGYRFFCRAQSVWVCSESPLPPLRYESVGMRMMSLQDRPWKPTTSALQIFGRYARKNVIHLSGEEARAFLAGSSVNLEADCQPGYVVVFYKGEVLGCGLYSRGTLLSQIPKERRVASWQGQEMES